MPNISAHMVVAKKIGEKFNINSDDFIRGNLLPDIIDIKDSHCKIEKAMYMVPNISRCIEMIDLNNDMQMGYFVHLLLDKHYLEDYLSKLYPNKNIFLDGKIYSDYDYINYKLVSHFKLDLDYLNQVLCTYNCKILKEKLKYNIECLRQNKNGQTKYLNFEDFSSFLVGVSEIISKELIGYANKSSKLCFRIKK